MTVDTDERRDPETRGYEMGRRLDQMARLRARIIASAITLYEERGPAKTSVTAIAERAGVTRMTVYRHFDSEAEFFDACWARWQSDHPAPDANRWVLVEDPEERLRLGLTELYDYYRDGAAMLLGIYRDADAVPAKRREAIEVRDGLWRDLLLAPFDAAPKVRGMVAVAAAYSTWRLLCVEERLSDGAAVSAMVASVMAVA